ncbi:hypothetical protein DQ04_14841000 [Trypanosoma grayi]|uniref:hypothetical protein n=1 Tax=Trypanosoma grayi TaxID=71804 RepID=UPI0004F4A0E7|nr:hypothetical protein DQ04_14841000 [Trypanosoma grayi]KEG06282.1 hypothetical protein DQ04_14841000 [Trypanosoma grayi]
MIIAHWKAVFNSSPLLSVYNLMPLYSPRFSQRHLPVAISISVHCWKGIYSPLLTLEKKQLCWPPSANLRFAPPMTPHLEDTKELRVSLRKIRCRGVKERGDNTKLD